MSVVQQHPDTKRSDDDIQEFIYPTPPDSLRLFTRQRLVKRPITPAVTFLERMLTKTSLTTQKVTHFNIEELGKQVHEELIYNYEVSRERAVKEAIKLTQEIAKKEQQRVLQQAMIQAKADKLSALEAQKFYYEQLAVRTREGRDKLEEEKIEQIIRKKDKEREQALEEQWQKAERIKRESIERALIEQHQRLRATAALQREKAIAQALRVARERFAVRLEAEIEEVKEKCRKIAEENTIREKNLHKVEIQRLNERIATLTEDSIKRLEKQKEAEKDFVGIENDYSRFLDFNQIVPCHSDFLVTPRKFLHGVGKGRRAMHAQTDLISFDQKSASVQTEVQIMARR